MDSDRSVGTVLGIQIAPANGVPMQPLATVRAVPDMGLVGDRYFGKPTSKRTSAITLVEQEALDALFEETGIRISLSETRRNVLTEGIDLNGLVGRRFFVGEVLLEGTELCQPCRHIAHGKPQVIRGLVHRGGLRARILSEGSIAVGNRAEPCRSPLNRHLSTAADVTCP